MAELGPRQDILELYGGSGALGRALAADGHCVELIEAFASEESKLPSVSGFSRRIGRVEDVLSQGRVRPMDVLLANPPRTGVPRRVRDLIYQSSSKLIAYVSCDPDTLARDLAHGESLGWTGELIPFDMMPQTSQIETLAFLRRTDVAPGKAPAPPELNPRRFAVLTHGVVRARGKIGRGKARYERLEVAGGHSLLMVEGTLSQGGVLAALSAIGHPALGDEHHLSPASVRYGFLKLAIDRPMIASVLDKSLGPVLNEEQLPGDMQLALERLRAREDIPGWNDSD